MSAPSKSTISKYAAISVQQVLYVLVTRFWILFSTFIKLENIYVVPFINWKKLTSCCNKISRLFRTFREYIHPPPRLHNFIYYILHRMIHAYQPSNNGGFEQVWWATTKSFKTESNRSFVEEHVFTTYNAI